MSGALSIPEPVVGTKDDPLHQAMCAMSAEIAELKRPRKILLVEDDVSLIELMQRWVAGYNASLSAETTYQAGLEAAQTGEFDLILLDVKLGGPETGVDLFAEIRRRIGDHPPVVIFTGLVTPQLTHAVEQIGFAPFIKKPEQINPRFIRSFLHCFNIQEKSEPKDR